MAQNKLYYTFPVEDKDWVYNSRPECDLKDLLSMLADIDLHKDRVIEDIEDWEIVDGLESALHTDIPKFLLATRLTNEEVEHILACVSNCGVCMEPECTRLWTEALLEVKNHPMFEEVADYGGGDPYS